jgi:hypothetical protein
MGGFPTRPNRDTFGPDYVDERAVQDATKEIAAAIFNLLFHQLAGIGKVVPRAVLVCTVGGSAVTTANQLLAWDPNDELSTLTWTYNGAGDFSIAFASQYEDEAGNDVNLSLIGGAAFAMGSTPMLGSVNLTSGYEAGVYFTTHAGVAGDPATFVVVFW